MLRRAWVLTAVGCAGPELAPPAEPVALVDVGAFVLAEVDPLDEADVDCTPAGFGLEGATLEVDTGACAHGVFEARLLADVEPWHRVELVFWHGDLVSDAAGAEGHLAVLVGDAVAFERRVAIPAEPDAHTVERSGLRARAGDAVVVHLHNHGANTWNLLGLERR